jgi:hypothetical protein
MSRLSMTSTPAGEGHGCQDECQDHQRCPGLQCGSWKYLDRGASGHGLSIASSVGMRDARIMVHMRR